SQGPALQVVQRVGQGLVRCLAREPGGGVESGAMAVTTGGPLLALLDVEMLARSLPVLDELARRRGASEQPELLETGIKAIDLLCPYVRGGTVGFFGPSGTGRMVVGA